MSSEVIKIGMPLHEWNKIYKIFQELDMDPEPYMVCRNYGKLRYELALLKFGIIKKKDFPGPEKYIFCRE